MIDSVVMFPGLGHNDWVELDLDAFDLAHHVGVVERLEASRDRIEGWLEAPFVVEPSRDGTADVVAGGRTRFRAEVNAAGRLVLTSAPDPEGPL